MRLLLSICTHFTSIVWLTVIVSGLNIINIRLGFHLFYTEMQCVICSYEDHSAVQIYKQQYKTYLATIKNTTKNIFKNSNIQMLRHSNFIIFHNKLVRTKGFDKFMYINNERTQN